MSIEETRKKLEKITGLPTTFHWENNGEYGVFSPGYMKFEHNGETKNDDFFGQKWNEAIDKGRKRMEEQASNINKFKNQLQGFKEGIDYAYDESKKTYIIHHEKLKNAFWGDASNEVEYKAIEDSNGNVQFRKSATFRSSKARKEENDQDPFVHSTEKLLDKQWKEKNLGTFPEKTPVSSVSKNNRGNFKEPPGFEGTEEEFGYYKQWKGWEEPFEEPTNTVYHRKREGDIFVERKKVWKDNDQTSSVNPQITGISDNMEIEDTKMTEVENQQVQSSHRSQEENSSQQQQQQQQPLYKWSWE